MASVHHDVPVRALAPLCTFCGKLLRRAESRRPNLPMDRVDSLIHELSTRHQNSNPRFLAAVRPMVVNILDPATPEEARVPLMEMLAETFERDVQVRRDSEATKVALAAFFERLKRMLRG